jgi:hypothetical protein
LLFEANTEAIPAAGMPVRVILKPVLKEDAKPADDANAAAAAEGSDAGGGAEQR